jgi:predicted transcriptional regulator
MKNRSRRDILRSILETASAGEGTSKTGLKYKPYLSFIQLKVYLGTLQQNSLIDYEAEKRCYKITEKGIRLLQFQNKLQEIAPISYVNKKNS